MYVCQWPIFHGPVILPYILNTICWTNAIIMILVPCDAKIYLIECMWVSDLHFMVQWFCLISWRLFDGLMLYWRYGFSVTQPLNWNYMCKLVTYISWSSDFALYLEDYLMDKCHNWNTGSMWSKDLPDKMYKGSVTYISWSSNFVLSWRLFGLMLYWRYWFNGTQTLNWNYICRPVVQWFCLISSRLLMDKCCSWNIGSIWCKD